MRNEGRGDAARENPVLPPPGKDRDFESVIHDFQRVLPANGEIDGTEDYLDRSEQFNRIEAEAQKLGYLYDRLGPEVEGGREHDLTYDEATRSVLKFTKPSSAAYVVEILGGRLFLSNGDPIEYLKRIALHEEIFGVESSFVGIGGEQNHRRIITRQALVKGKPTWWPDITKMMVNELGFRKLNGNFGIGYVDSYAYVREEVAVFDMRPANVFETAGHSDRSR